MTGKGRKMNRKNEGISAFFKGGKGIELIKKLKRFKEDNDKKIKVAAAVTVIAAAALFFVMKGESQNSALEDEMLALSEENAGKGGESSAEDLGEYLPVIYVDISGAVNEPGVYDVKEGTRVFEVIEMAGGLTDTADIDGFNRAEEVFDGQKLTIPEKIQDGTGSGASAPAGVSASGLININRATEDELDEIPGVGPSTAKAIIAYREENGSFRKKEDIKNVSGIGDKTFEKMKDNITV